MTLTSKSTQIKQEKNEKDFKTMTLQKQLAFIKRVITLEPLVICYTIGKSIIDPALKNLELEKSCRVNSHFNNTICNDITSGTYEENNFTVENNIVQSHITKMHSWQLTTTNVLAVIIILLLGSFSDRYHIRKPFILFTLFGQILALGGCIFCVYFMNEWSLEVLGFAQEIVYSMFGGEKMLLMVIYAYIADISTPHMRTMRMSIIQAIWNVCCTIGQTLGGTLCRHTSYMAIFGIALILFTTAFLYGFFIVKEPRKSLENTDTTKMLLDVFNPQYIFDTFKLFSRYKGRYRINIISILIVHYTYSTINNGESSVMFLFTQTAYEWTVTTYTGFAALTTVGNSFGLFVVVPLFTKVFHMDDLLIIVCSNLSKMISNTLIFLIRSPTGLYIGCAAGAIKSTALVGIRSQLTKYVSQDDVGKVLSMFTVVDSFGDGISSQIYNHGIYEQTRETFPHAFLLLGIALHLLGTGIVIWMYARKKIQTSRDQKMCSTNMEIQRLALGTEITHL